MILWIVLTVLTSLAVAGVTIPLVRRHDLKAARETNVAVLRMQLGEIDTQQSRGTIGAEEADGLRAEIKRRLLSEGLSQERPSRPIDTRALPWLALGLAAVIALTATGLYAVIGRPGLTGARTVPADRADAAAHPIADVSTMVARLEEHLKQMPNDAEGWRMLGWSYRSVGRSADAANAYAHAIALDPANAEYQSARGDALVDAAGGQVTPDALDAFHAALKIDPTDPQARYFLALFEDQQGKHDEAMNDWIALLKSAPPGAAWEAEVRDFVERVARERHIDISRSLPARPSPAPPPAAPSAATNAMPAPTAGQVDAANQMSPGDREAMIRAMVDRLADELKANPRNVDGWIRLMRARIVLGDASAAAAAYRDSEHAFANSPPDLEALRNAANALGVAGR
jgi:cytochrome c-type biogenesis protein CcmH